MTSYNKNNDLGECIKYIHLKDDKQEGNNIYTYDKDVEYFENIFDYEYDEDDEKENFVDSNDEESTGGRSFGWTFFILGCITMCGFRGKMVKKIAFAPPFVKGYHIENDNKFIFHNSQHEDIKELMCVNNIDINYKKIKRGSTEVSGIMLYKKPLDLTKQTILYSHGNTTDIGYMTPFLLNLVSCNNVNAFSYDYSGYGLSNKDPSEKNCYKSIKMSYDYLTKDLNIKPENIIVYGHSLGSATSCYLINLKKIKVGGCILQSPLFSGLRLLLPLDYKKEMPWFDVFQNDKRLKNIPVIPLFIMHGKNDTVIPYQHSEYLLKIVKKNFAKKVQKKKSQYLRNKDINHLDTNDSVLRFWGVDNADHNDIGEKNPELFHHKLGEFLSYCCKFNMNE
ncbi:alpha/beta hydrolase fold domain containing protein, putative [Plasmodium sp. DRC-Itaito]|nr:alpha/beta hydrolase fold domain containing protein, putative [Plasmodium sp. DRC-Itaito]